MGFWHTGYFEFHEQVGYGEGFLPRPTVYTCSHCGESFTSNDALRIHRFERHPHKRPILILRGLEIGNATASIFTRRGYDKTDTVLNCGLEPTFEGSLLNSRCRCRCRCRCKCKWQNSRRPCLSRSSDTRKIAARGATLGDYRCWSKGASKPTKGVVPRLRHH